MADRSGLTYLWLGAKLQSDTEEWKQSGWITGEDWTFDNWYPGEPSRQDTDGTKELFLCMWKAKYNEEEIGWTFNDQRNDIEVLFRRLLERLGMSASMKEKQTDEEEKQKRMIFGIAGILFMAGVVIGIIGVLGKGEKEQKQTRTKTDTIEAASELEQEKGMPTGSDDEKVKTETTPKGTEEEVTAVTESPEKTETEDIAEPLEQAGKRGDDEKKTDEQTEQTVEEKAQNMMEHMSLEEKIYQLFVVTPEQLTGVSTVTMAGDTTRAALEAQPVGGIVFFAPNLLNREQTITMIQNMQSYSKTGLFIAVDEEGGSVMRLGNNSEMGITAIPSMESVGDTEDISQAYRVGNTIGSEISQLGFNLDFAPVADVNSNPNNTVIGSRAFGTDPEKVAEMVAACVKDFATVGWCAR